MVDATALARYLQGCAGDHPIIHLECIAEVRHSATGPAMLILPELARMFTALGLAQDIDQVADVDPGMFVGDTLISRIEVVDGTFTTDATRLCVN